MKNVLRRGVLGILAAGCAVAGVSAAGAAEV